MEPNLENTNNNPSPQTSRLIEVLQTLEKNIKKQNSLKYAFLRGMVYGLGTVIGATVLVALFGGIIISVINTITDSDITPATLKSALSAE